MNYLIILPVVTAFLLGGCIAGMKFETTEKLNKYAVMAASLVSFCTAVVLISMGGEHVVLFSFNDALEIAFKVDGLSTIFAAMVSFLWPLAVVYATEYMKHEGGQQKFFTFYIMTFGVTLGIAFSANMLTLYLCYEMLTFITLPLVMHNIDNRSIYAGRKYLIYSVSGASVAFIGMMIIMSVAGNTEFVYGGLLTNVSENTALLVAYVLMFVGFGVKAAIFPLHGWLPGASVAPTTVTALLHAVAVVKAGVFAIMRATYYLFGAEYLYGTWAQSVVMAIAVITICFGSWMALRSKHFKRRLAYSTVSQLSYILLGVTVMTADGFTGALSHMIFHALMKIVLFYTAGSVLYMNHKEYIRDVEGYGAKMPKTFACFALCSLALIGVPPLAGFFSKFSIATAAVKTGMVTGYMGVAALIFSALFTAMYLLQIVVLAYLPHKDFETASLTKVKEAPKAMTMPMVVITVTMVVLSLFSSQLFSLFEIVAKGGF
ncbi:MAG: proton-conducting membrane transporter [Oscillospiraceae bacterium]|nr:proton-conducting membrane transporter [Oscillospiraceae bacterium]